MPKVLILKGLPASGKSTFAKEKLKEGNWKRINKDDLRAMLDDSKWSRENEKLILTLRDEMILACLKSGRNVIVDDTNFAKKHETEIRELAKSYNAEVEIKFFDTPLEECIKRDSKREKPVGEKVIREMYNKYLKEEIKTYPHDPSLPWCIISDIDGTLAEKCDRSPYEWQKVGQDKVIEPIKLILNSMKQNLGYDVICFSGRDEACRNETENWLTENGIIYNALYMRPQGDMRKDSVVKEELFDKHIRGKYNVFCIFDDRLQVCRMWHKLGLPLLKVGDPDSNF
jgi:predicted kinase